MTANATTTDIDLIPVRALNQVTYCPRLYYLEYVESLMRNNEHVEDGLFQHRRVNDPALANRTRKDGDVFHTRSVSLSSERLGISAKLDLLEERDGEIRPIEYKRSEAPNRGNGHPGYWDNDAVQLCAQGLLIEEELGVPVPEGVLYYIGSKTRVDVPLDEALREKTLDAIRLIRDLAARDAPPEPLPAELRHRCYGCSLVTVCQPEETLYLIGREPESIDATEDPSSSPLRLVTAGNDDGAVLYLQEPGAHVGKRSEHLVVHLRGEEINRVPIAATRQVVVFGNVQVSTQALECLATSGVPVVYLTGYGRFVAALQPAPAKNVNLRADQYRVFTDPVRALALSKEVVRAKIANQRTLLMRSLRTRSLAEVASGQWPVAGEAEATEAIAAADASAVERGSPDPALPTSLVGRGSPDPALPTTEGLPASDIQETFGPGIGGVRDPRRTEGAAPPHSTRGSDEPAARDMAELLLRLDRANDPGVLLGIEGQAAALYFAEFGRMLKSSGPGRPFDFTKRNRRPPRDPVNCLLSFAYAMLAKDCFSAVCTVGFDPYQGFYHAGRHGRPSLALDLMEEFRAIIADSVVLTLINNGIMTERDFLVWREACQLTDDGRKKFFQAYEQRKSTVVTHPTFGYKMSYGRMLEVQARLLAAYVRGDVPQYVGFTVR